MAKINQVIKYISSWNSSYDEYVTHYESGAWRTYTGSIPKNVRDFVASHTGEMKFDNGHSSTKHGTYFVYK